LREILKVTPLYIFFVFDLILLQMVAKKKPEFRNVKIAAARVTAYREIWATGNHVAVEM
jgi:hypothetical protein